jgi:hypothetical protein
MMPAAGTVACRFGALLVWFQNDRFKPRPAPFFALLRALARNNFDRGFIWIWSEQFVTGIICLSFDWSNFKENTK